LLATEHPIPPTVAHDGSISDCPVCHGKRIIKCSDDTIKEEQ
jgi:hypothetical protein